MHKQDMDYNSCPLFKDNGEKKKKKDKGPGEKQPSVVFVASRPGGRPLMEREWWLNWWWVAGGGRKRICRGEREVV
jgi:hypothetical protein